MDSLGQRSSVTHPHQQRHESDNRHINHELRGHNEKSILRQGVFQHFGIHSGSTMGKKEDARCYAAKDEKCQGRRHAHQQDIEQVNFCFCRLGNWQRLRRQWWHRFELRDGIE